MQQKRQFMPPFPEELQQERGDHYQLDWEQANTFPRSVSDASHHPQMQPHFQLPTHMKPQSRREMVHSGLPTAERKRYLRQQRQTSQRHKRQRKPGVHARGRRLRRLVIVCTIFMLIVGIVFSQGNGGMGAWFADTFRAAFGATATAQIESWYLGITDIFHQTQFQLSGKQVSAPWTVTPTTQTHSITPAPAAPHTIRPVPISLQQIPALFSSSSIPGAGTWITVDMAPSPYSYMPLVAKTFIQPDPARPYAVATILQFDSRFILLHMVAGTSEPGGALGVPGSGRISANDQAGNALLAAFNGGFKYADGQYGMSVNGVQYVPPQPGAATIAVTTSGQIILGAWGVDPRLNSNNSNLVAWRQNAALLIKNGMINPLTQDGAAWGATILNSASTWRSGIGITAQGTLLYAAGNSLTASTLAIALKAAGAVMAMQTDINPYWVRAFLYNRTTNGSLSIEKLNPSMQGTGAEYLYGTSRDFFYLTRVTPPLSALLPAQP